MKKMIILFSMNLFFMHNAWAKDIDMDKLTGKKWGGLVQHSGLFLQKIINQL